MQVKENREKKSRRKEKRVGKQKKILKSINSFYILLQKKNYLVLTFSYKDQII